MGGVECRPSMPEVMEDPCGGSCPTGQLCVDDSAGGSACLPEDTTCAPACGGDAVCVLSGGVAECRIETPYSIINGFPDGNGLFTSVALGGLPNNAPVVVYYDRIRRQLRGGEALFNSLQQVITSGFSVGPVVCDAVYDVGQHAALAFSPTDSSVVVAYQSMGGEVLSVFRGSGIFDSNGVIEVVDDGARSSGASFVGAFADVAFDNAGRPYIAYADQTNNDLVLAYPSAGVWKHLTLKDQGAFGSFANIAISGAKGYVSSYHRFRDEFSNDISRVVVEVIDLQTLP